MRKVSILGLAISIVLGTRAHAVWDSCGYDCGIFSVDFGITAVLASCLSIAVFCVSMALFISTIVQNGKGLAYGHVATQSYTTPDRYVLKFVALGPLVGYIVVGLALIHDGGDAAFFIFVLLGLPYAYLIAAVPAALTGVFYYWLVPRRLSTRVNLAATSLLGALATVTWTKLLSLEEGELAFGLAGAAAGAVCGIFVSQTEPAQHKSQKL